MGQDIDRTTTHLLPDTGRLIHGIDFTSSPRPGKPINIATGRHSASVLHLDALERLPDWSAFESWLARPGPWLGGFDFPFGLPREAVTDMGWPLDWAELVRHCQSIGRLALRAAFDSHRAARPMGMRYAHRATDRPAGSHSPLKLVNPPVGLMFLEGTPRLLEAGVDIPGLYLGDPSRQAVEAYPGLVARRVTAASYKSDTRARQTAARRLVREQIVTHAMTLGIVIDADPASTPIRLALDERQAAELIDDASGDLLDATLAALQAVWCDQRRTWHHGLPPDLDPIEGWIAGAPWSKP
jgi:hypothetical protein